MNSTEQALPNVFNHLFRKQQVAMTSSLDVAEYFGKRHKNVLQAIETLECSDDFRRLNFQPSYYHNEQNKRQPMFRLTRDGFTFLAMGFTGKKAAKFKEAYITAFNEMEMWITQRQAVKRTQPMLNEAIHYQEVKTGKKDVHAYCRENNLVYVVAVGSNCKTWLRLNGYPSDDEIRQHLTQAQLSLIDLLIVENAVMLKLGLAYAERKAKLTDSALYYWQQREQKSKGQPTQSIAPAVRKN